MREFDRRPWGTYTVLEEDRGFKVKRIEVLPGEIPRLSSSESISLISSGLTPLGFDRVTVDPKGYRRADPQPQTPEEPSP